MDKEALINIILSDLGEIETMVKSFKGQGEIPIAFIELTEKKMTHLIDEFSLLKSLNDNKPADSKADESIYKSQDTVVHDSPSVTPRTEEEIPTPPPSEPLAKPVELGDLDVENNSIEKSKESEIKPADTVEPALSENVKRKDNMSVIVEAKTEASIKTIGESFGGEKKSVNDSMAKSQQSNEKKTIKGKPIGDLTKGLGINDRFMFQRELFAGKAEVMNQALQQINQMPDLNSAVSFIQSNFDWDGEQEATLAFLSYIERKF